MNNSGVSAAKVRCRLITEKDLERVAVLLARGFPGRSVEHWLRGLRKQAARRLSAEIPQFGYLLESEGRTVGALLLIYAERNVGGETILRCNLSSWYVDPDFRSHASLLTAVAQKNRAVTFVNLTAATHTWPIIEAQGFRRACEGLFFSIPLFARGGSGVVSVVRSNDEGTSDLPEAEGALLRHHAALGCLSVICQTAAGLEPFIFSSYRVRRGRFPLPGMRLIYARDLDAYRRCAGALGAFLLKRGRGFVVLAANGPVPGLAGVFTARRGRRYVRGPYPPSLYDLTDSELVVYGL